MHAGALAPCCLLDERRPCDGRELLFSEKRRKTPFAATVAQASASPSHFSPRTNHSYLSCMLFVVLQILTGIHYLT